MTGKEVYDAALALLFETKNSAGEDYEAFSRPLLNLLLIETKKLNDHLRDARGMEPLKDFAALDSMDDEIPYEPDFTGGALPYGLAAKLLIADDESDRGQDYLILFTDAVNLILSSAPHPVADVYGDT